MSAYPPKADIRQPEVARPLCAISGRVWLRFCAKSKVLPRPKSDTTPGTRRAGFGVQLWVPSLVLAILGA